MELVPEQPRYPHLLRALDYLNASTSRSTFESQVIYSVADSPTLVPPYVSLARAALVVFQHLNYHAVGC